MAQFQPGQSGNPGGRPKGEAKVRAAAQEHGEAAIGVLFAALSDEDARVRIKAAEVLLDRGFGKPHQTQELDIRGSLTQTIEALPVRIRE